MHIIYFGNWNLGYLSLKKLVEQNISVDYVVTNYELDCDDEYRNKVYDYAKSRNISTYKSYKDILPLIKQGDIGFSVAYGNEIFKEDILSILTIYNFHSSYLPYHKGGSPILWQIKYGENAWGMSCHKVDHEIDAGEIIDHRYYEVNKKNIFAVEIDNYNLNFSEFVFDNCFKIVMKNNQIALFQNDNENYEPRIKLPQFMWNISIEEIENYLDRKRVAIFIGNRAELGILFPMIIELGKQYYVDIIVLKQCLQDENDEFQEKIEMLNSDKIFFDLVVLETTEKYDYYKSISNVYNKVLNRIEKNRKYEYIYAIVLGDRIESYGFALAAFYGRIPLVHIAGGDVANVPYFDTNVRHSISKLANIHFPFSEQSREVLLQLGEEEFRVFTIGNPTFDYSRLGLLPKKEMLNSMYQLEGKSTVIFTYHAGPYKSIEQNLMEYKNSLIGVLNSEVDRIIITYPNTDPKSESILEYINNMVVTDRIRIVKSLGTINMQGIMCNYKTVVVGNSSSGLLETAFYNCPAINIGDRQIDRTHGNNVIDMDVDSKKITEKINYIIANYETFREKNKQSMFMFGDGNSAYRAVSILKEYELFNKEKILIKKFIRR